MRAQITFLISGMPKKKNPHGFRDGDEVLITTLFLHKITFTTLWVNLTDKKTHICLFLLENMLWYFVQIVSTGHRRQFAWNKKKQQHIFWNKKDFFFFSQKTVSAEIFTQRAKN